MRIIYHLVIYLSIGPYEFVSKYRDMIEQIVNSNLIKCGIA